MTNLFRIATLTVVSLPLMANSNGPGGGQQGGVAGRVAFLARLLTLTTAQQTQATTIFTTEQTAIQSAETILTTARTALVTAVEANDSAGIAAAVTQIGTYDSDVIQAEATADAAFYAILTSSQQTIDQELLSTGFGDFADLGGDCLGLGSSSTTTPTVAQIVAARVAHLTNLLTLTTAQVTQATAIFTTDVTADQTAHAGLTTAHATLITDIEANSASAIASDVATIVALYKQIVLADATGDAAFYAILTTSQQTIDKQLLSVGFDAAGLVRAPIGIGSGGRSGSHGH